MNTGSAEAGGVDAICNSQHSHLVLCIKLFSLSDDDTREFNHRFHANFKASLWYLCLCDD